MNLKHFLLLLPAAVIAGVVFGQGPLTPPGAPAPAMKSLDQVEPRTPISSLPFTISQGGSYYLTRSLSVASGDAITITANDVTLDLGGFTLSSMATAPGSGTAVLLTNSKPENIAIRNGHIRSTTILAGGIFSKGGFQNGIGSSAAPNDSTVQVSDVNIAGVAEAGIYLLSFGNALVERCSVRTSGGRGIAGAVIRHCSVTAAWTTALEGRVISHSVGRCEGNNVNDTSPAIKAEIVECCEGVSTVGAGIAGTVVSNSIGTSSSNFGIYASTSAINCSGTSSSSFGIRAANATNCEGKSASQLGMDVDRNATNCYGESGSGPFGLYVQGTASFCRGRRTGGIAISAGIAVGCTVSAGTVQSAQKHLGTP